MKDIKAFIKANGLSDSFIEGEDGSLRPTKETLDKISSIAYQLTDGANKVAELLEESIETIALDALGTSALNYEFTGRVMLDGGKEARGVKTRMKADVRVSRDGKVTVFTFAQSDAKGAISEVENRMAKNPLLAIFLTPSNLLFREDLYHAICLSVTVMNLKVAMDKADQLDDDLLAAIKDTEKGTPIERKKLELAAEDLPKRAV